MGVHGHSENGNMVGVLGHLEKKNYISFSLAFSLGTNCSDGEREYAVGVQGGALLTFQHESLEKRR